ncbi:hypothetical protein OAT18_00545 [Tenacibaculum sp.]|nr:hypothetical protein [Tenacibaculum sp.]
MSRLLMYANALLVREISLSFPFLFPDFLTGGDGGGGTQEGNGSATFFVENLIYCMDILSVQYLLI